jgi:thiol:disulfide interchange protein DsbD
MKTKILSILVFLLLIPFRNTAVSEEKIKAPNFSLKTYDGRVIELEKLKGKIVIINFWATWCPPCRAEIPDFIKVYDDYKSRGLEIIGIALDEGGWEKVKPFSDEYRINYPVVLGNLEVVRNYGGINSIPTTFAVDKDGNVVAARQGMLSKESLENKIKSLLSVQEPPKPKPSPSPTTNRQVNVETFLSADKIRAGGTAQIALQLHIGKGWHINSHKPTFDYLIGTSFELGAKEGIILTDLQYPSGIPVLLSFSDTPLDVYEDTVTIYASVKTSGKLTPGKDTIGGNLTIQACNDRICLPPSTIELRIPVEIAGPGDAISLQNQNIFAAYHPSAETAIKAENPIETIFQEKGYLPAFLAIFLIGLALNLTPCVYPMLSVTVSLFGSQSESNFMRVFLKAVTYVVGIATMYSILGVTAALGGGLFGSWLQSPWVLGGIALLLFALALSSFGLYQIQLPYWVTKRVSGISGSGFIAVYLSGLVVGVFAAPCVGPPVIALLAFVASKGSTAFGFWSFFILALGLGFPYLILGTFSGLIKKIPRSGSWLLWVEHIFGVILLGAALFYLFLAVAPKSVLYVIPSVLVIGGIYLGFIDRSGKEKPLLRRIQYVFGAAVILIGILYANSLADKGISWETYSDKEYSEAAENGMPILLDFYADWCIPCLELDRNTWTDQEVIRSTGDMKKLKVDLTHFDSRESEAIRKRFNISGVPTVIFIRADGTEAADSRISGFIPPAEFLAKLKQAMSPDK